MPDSCIHPRYEKEDEAPIAEQTQRPHPLENSMRCQLIRMLVVSLEISRVPKLPDKIEKI